MGAGTLINVPDRRNHVYDPHTDRLYVGTSSGSLLVYNVATNTLLPPIAVGNSLNGMDITPDGSTLYVAEGRPSGSDGVIYKIDLNSLAVTPLTYPRGEKELEAWDLAIASNGKAFFTSHHQLSGISVALREIDLATDEISVRGGTTRRTRIVGSADRSVLYFPSASNSGGPITSYVSDTDSFTARVDLTGFNGPDVTTNGDGSLIARTIHDNRGTISVLNSSYQELVRGGGGGGGLQLDPNHNILYAASFETNPGRIVALRADTLSELYSFDYGERVRAVRGFGFEGVEMSISDNSEFLFASRSDGILMLRLPTVDDFDLINGNFRTEGLEGWSTTGRGAAAVISTGPDVFVAELTASVALSQQVDFSDQQVLLTFDYRFLSTDGSLEVLLDSTPVDSFAAPLTLANGFQSRTVVIDPDVMAGAELAFRFDGPRGSKLLLAEIATSVPKPLSDLTNNGFVDFEDLTILLAAWNQHVPPEQGNLVDPSRTPVNFEDLTVLLADWTGPGPAGSPEAALGAEAVPEPSTTVLAVLGLLGLCAFARRPRRVRRADNRHTRLAVEPLESRRMLAVMSFQDGVFPAPDYAGTRDVSLFGAEESMNFGDESTLRADAEQGSTGFPVWSLMKWDLSGIPAAATISDVSITVNVTNTTAAPGFDLLAMRTGWIESEATWLGPTGTSTWEEPGVTDPADFNPTVLGTATGPLTVLLNSAGRAVVSGWLADPASNHGFLLTNPANDNSLRFDSREGTTTANRPKLSIDFTFNDVDPPTVALVDPLDGGPADEDSNTGEVRVGVRDTFIIGLDDFALNDTTVTADTLSVTKDAAPFTDFTFAFDPATDRITLTPTAGSFDEGLYSITLSGGASKIADETGNLLSATVLTIDIDAGLPTTPVAEDDSYETAEDTPLVADPEAGVLDNDFGGNAPGDAVLVAGPSHGTLDLNPDGSFTYTPADNFAGQDSFTYTLVTPLFTSNIATATIDVVNQSPVTTGEQYVVTEDELLSVPVETGVLVNDSDPQDDDINAELVSDVANGTLTLDPDGSFTYRPNENFFGTDSFRYRASDGQHESASTLVQITVQDVNDPPLALDDEYVVGVGRTLRIASAYDEAVVDAGPVGYWRLGEAVDSTTAEDVMGAHDGVYQNFVAVDYERLGALPRDPDTSVSFDGVNNLVTVPHSAELAITGDFTVEFWMYKTAEASDWQLLVGKTSERIRTFGVWEESGNGKKIVFQQMTESRTVVVNVISNAVVELNRWHYIVATVEGDTANIYIDSRLDAQGTRRGAVGVDTHPLTFGKMPGRFAYFPGRLDEVAIYNRALSAFEIQEHFRLGTEQDGTGTVGVLGNDLDVDGDELSASLADDVKSGTLDLADDGSFSYTPNPGFAGIDTFTYVASDGQSTSNVATVTIRVGVEEVPADLTGSGFVDFQDLTILLANWDQNVSISEGNLVDADTTPVNFEDLTVLLAAWTGPKPADSPQPAASEAIVRQHTPTIDRRAATTARFDQLGRRAHTLSRRIDSSIKLSSRDSPLRRLQAAAVDRAMGEDFAEMIVRRRPPRRGR
ncbi:MAG: tandem-95 repeat protein [Planctomycetes bacterium]|nr:tandem-95 repeat protein [Planctomycetota bacterium]